MAHRVCFLSAIAGLTLALFLSASRAGDVEANDDLASYVGVWTVATSDGEDCKFFLSDMPTGAGYTISMSDNCVRSDRVLTQVGAWRPRPGGGLVMLDRDGQMLVEWAVTEAVGLDSVMPRDMFLTMIQAVSTDWTTATVATDRRS